jgi:hypothetical protein
MGIITDSTKDDFDKALAKNISEELVKQHPGYTWAVSVDSQQGIGRIRLAEFSMEWGYTFKLSEIDHDPSYKKAVKGGGEILERLGWPRSRANEDRINTTKCFLGKPIFDYHCSVNSKVSATIKYAYDKLR